jgi:hypothetical protein
LVRQESTVDSFTDAINSLLQLLIGLGNLIISALIAIEIWLRDHLAQFGLPPNVQTIIMLCVAAVLILGALRLFGGLIRVGVVIILILVAIHIVLPILPHAAVLPPIPAK